MWKLKYREVKKLVLGHTPASSGIGDQTEAAWLTTLFSSSVLYMTNPHTPAVLYLGAELWLQTLTWDWIPVPGLSSQATLANDSFLLASVTLSVKWGYDPYCTGTYED